MAAANPQVTAVAPGRVNLIGEHTDTTGGRCLPMAVDLATTVTGTPGGARVVLRSTAEAGIVDLPLDGGDLATARGWGRYVAGVVAEVRPATGFTGTVTTTLPVGAGLSSSAALEVAIALALGAADDDLDPLALARACQRAEQRASGVPCGVMDQVASTAGVAGHALLLDCHDLTVVPVPIPDDVEVVAVPSGERRTLAGSAYVERRAELAAAEAVVGPLRAIDDGAALDELEPRLRRRARHVVTENGRVGVVVEALRAGDRATLGEALAASHASLRDDFEVSTPALDALVADLSSRPGVLGARLTGAGFGGCAVALCRPGTLDVGWVLHPSAGARVSRR
jgi:galactokinase